jgi:dephospho-CoA kinase
MMLFALTGSIGSGKSSVAGRLAARGAVIIDADAVTKQLQQPGTEVVAAMAEALGAEILGPDGGLDRAAVAEIVFNDRSKLAALNDIVHPAVRREMARQTKEAGAAGLMVVQDIPLFAETDYYKRIQWSGVIVVDTPPDVAVERLMAHRGFTEADARARLAAQATREARLARADYVVDNSGAPEALDAEVDRCWAWMGGRPDVPVPGRKPTAEGVAPEPAG